MLVYLSVLIDNEEDRQKFLKIYELHKKKMLYSAYKILHNQYDAEDAVQEAFIAVARHLTAIENPADYRTAAYVTITTKNMALKILQKKTSAPVFYENEEDEIPDNIDFVEKICEQEEVKIYFLKYTSSRIHIAM